MSCIISMAALEQEECILHLIDSFWFEHEIFKPNPRKVTQKTSHIVPQQDDKFKLSCPPALILRSFSEEALNSKYELLHEDKTESSPKSVLVSPKLQPILSGKEVQAFDEKENEFLFKKTEEYDERETRTRRRKKGSSKSLSELEFEELKGFMDLGFVFDNVEVKNSSLVSILPGLQRLSVANEGQLAILDNEDTVSRPYLSEAWEVLEEKQQRKVVHKIEPLMNWRIPNFGNEMELKDHLRIWAHNVAATVR